MTSSKCLLFNFASVHHWSVYLVSARWQTTGNLVVSKVFFGTNVSCMFRWECSSVCFHDDLVCDLEYVGDAVLTKVREDVKSLGGKLRELWMVELDKVLSNVHTSLVTREIISFSLIFCNKRCWKNFLQYTLPSHCYDSVHVDLAYSAV